MKILVTGAFGFLGFNLVKVLSEKHTIVGLYNSDIKSNTLKNTSFYNDLESMSFVPEIIVMCHAAVSSGNVSIENQFLYECNVKFTEKVYNKFPEAKIIYISTCSIYGNDSKTISESSKISPESAYSISKLWGEKIVLRNKNNSVIRFSSLYGNEMKENTLIPNYCNQALKAKTISVWGDGSRKQNYMHINDAVKLIDKVIAFDGFIDFPILGVSNGEYSNIEIAQIIAESTNAKINFENNDNSPSYHYNNTLTQKILNWQSEITIEKGLKKYLEWKQR